MAIKKDGVSYESIVRDVQAGHFASVYYLMGEEDYYIDKLSEYIANKAVKPEDRDFNLTVVYGADVKAAQVAEMAARYPMMADRQVVWVREAQQLDNLDALTAYLKNPQPATVLIFSHKHGTFDKRKKFATEVQKVGIVFESPLLRDDKLPAFVNNYARQRKEVIEPSAVEMICEHVGANLTRLASEIDKLILAKPKGEGRITADLVEATIGVSKIFNNFELINALRDKDVYKANMIAKYFNTNPKGFAIQQTLATMFGFFADVMVAYYAPDRSVRGIVEWLGVNPYRVEKGIMPAMKKYSGVKVMQIIGKLREMDAKSKGVDNTIADSGSLLTELIYFILH